MSWNEWDTWQREQGRRFGPAPWRPAFRHPDNQKGLDTPIVLQPYSGTLTSPTTQVFQIIPPGNYNAVYIRANDPGGTGYLRGFWGVVGSREGVVTYSADPTGPDAFVFPTSLLRQWVRVDLPYGNVPLVLHAVAPSGLEQSTGPVEIRANLLTVPNGRRVGTQAVAEPCDCAITPQPPTTQYANDNFNRNGLGLHWDTGQDWQGDLSSMKVQPDAPADLELPGIDFPGGWIGLNSGVLDKQVWADIGQSDTISYIDFKNYFFPTTTGPALMFRVQDDSHFWQVRLWKIVFPPPGDPRPPDFYWELDYIDGVAFVQVAQMHMPLESLPYAGNVDIDGNRIPGIEGHQILKVICNEQNIMCFINDFPLFGYASTKFQTAGGYGVRMNRDGLWVNEIRVSW